MITLLLGGARSGKSQAAERMAATLVRPVTYVATAALADGDQDLLDRVAAHRARRDPSWPTIEAGGELPAVLVATEGTVVVDSLGPWVTTQSDEAASDFAVDVAGLRDALAGRAGDTVVVSEEVGLGVHPSTEAGRRFRDALGALNVAVADVADTVYLVVAGRLLPLERRADQGGRDTSGDMARGGGMGATGVAGDDDGGGGMGGGRPR